MTLAPSPLHFAADLLDPSLNALWTPWPKQELATQLSDEADEMLFGGAAGPGKTEWLIRDAIRNMEMYPNNYGVIFRRTFPALRRTIIPRMNAALAGRADYNKTEHTWTFPNGSVLEASHLQYEDDARVNWQGSELGWIGWEELTEFLQAQYEYLITRLRAPSPGIRPRSVATTNPGGSGHRWVKRRWIKPVPDQDLDPGAPMPKPGKVWRPKFDPLIHSEDAPPLRRVYIPAVYSDNPTLLERDPAYLSKLRSQSSRAMRLALETGDWDAIDVVDGALWSMIDLDAGRADPTWYKQKVKIARRCVALDPDSGGEDSDGYGVSVCARGMDGVMYVEASYEWRNVSVRTLAKKSIELSRDVGADVIVLERNHGAKWLLEVFRTEDPYANVKDVWASDGKRVRAEPVAALFEIRQDIELPFRARIVGHQPDLEDELTTTTFAPGEPSPNLLDALVWCGTELMLRPTPEQSTMEDRRLAGRR